MSLFFAFTCQWCMSENLIKFFIDDMIMMYPSYLNNLFVFKNYVILAVFAAFIYLVIFA